MPIWRHSTVDAFPGRTIDIVLRAAQLSRRRVDRDAIAYSGLIPSTERRTKRNHEQILMVRPQKSTLRLEDIGGGGTILPPASTLHFLPALAFLRWASRVSQYD
jgi:hypothetical protein